MKCLRFDIARRLTAYLDGELPAAAVKRVEGHLLDCLDCRARLVRLRAGRRFAQKLGRRAPRRDAWDAIEAALDAEPNHAAAVPAARPGRVLALGRTGWAVALALLALNVSVFVWHAAPRRQPALAPEQDADLDRADFFAVKIADMRDNTKPHIVAEGRVEEVGVDREDGNMTFKLVDDQHASNSFVVCEVIHPLQITPPPVGSRVRVYGVSRFDNQADHEWYEIHPVLGIEMLQSK